MGPRLLRVLILCGVWGMAWLAAGRAQDQVPDVAALRGAAAKGDVRAMVALGRVYGLGEGVPVDREKAFALYGQAAAKGFPPAEYGLAMLYKSGLGTAADPGEAFRWLKRAAEAGYAPAEGYLGVVFHTGSLGQQVDEGRARDWLEKAALGGEPSAAGMMADFCEEGIGAEKDPAGAFGWALRGALGGDVGCQNRVASFYARGVGGVPQDDGWAWTWSCLAARNSKADPQALATVADLQRQLAVRLGGEGVEAATQRADAYLEGMRQGGFCLVPPLAGDAVFTLDSEAGVTFDNSSNYIVIPVMIGGAGPFHFALDTGSNASLIDAGIAKRLGLKAVAPYPGEAGDGGGVREVLQADYAAAGARVERGLFLAASLELLTRPPATRIDGLLGYDFISQFVVEVDYDGKRVSLHPPGAYRYGGAGEAIPIGLAAGLASAPVTLGVKDHEPITVPLVLDTGLNGGIALGPRFDRRYGFAALVPKVGFGDSVGVRGDDLVRRGELPFVLLGHSKIVHPEVRCFSAEEGNFGKETVGGGILSDFKLILDYPAQEIFLEEGSAFHRATGGD